uniref:Uncharacterized protein n=1 Tax=Oryza sativa subsp. japonica TaxID=39947 RepID=Q6YY68_ORYSJ|nr:hypothetical protein [Oryza sativa Japonica Group]
MPAGGIVLVKPGRVLAYPLSTDYRDVASQLISSLWVILWFLVPPSPSEGSGIYYYSLILPYEESIQYHMHQRQIFLKITRRYEEEGQRTGDTKGLYIVSTTTSEEASACRSIASSLAPWTQATQLQRRVPLSGAIRRSIHTKRSS